MAVGTVAAFWGLSFLLVLTPGADRAYVIGAGLRERTGRRTVLPAVGGLVLGYLVLTAAVAAGVAAVVARSPTVLTVLTALGATYLIWAGPTGLARPGGAVTGIEQGHGSWARQAVRGAGISGLNPKALLLFLALLPQFTQPAAGWPVAAQIALLGVLHTVSCAVVYTGVGVGARSSGAAMLVIGTVLLVEQVAA